MYHRFFVVIVVTSIVGAYGTVCSWFRTYGTYIEDDAIFGLGNSPLFDRAQNFKKLDCWMVFSYCPKF